MTRSPDAREPVDGERLAEAYDEFVRRRDAGESPAVEEFVARYPDVAETLRGILGPLAEFRAAPDGESEEAEDSPSPAPEAEAESGADLGAESGAEVAHEAPQEAPRESPQEALHAAVHEAPHAAEAAIASPSRAQAHRAGGRRRALVGGVLLAVLGLGLYGALAGWFSGGRKQATPRREFVDGDHMRLVLVPAGEFTMGGAEVEHLLLDPDHRAAVPRLRSELPPRRVRISRPFYLGVHEVTVAEFRKFVEQTGYTTDLEKSGRGVGWDVPKFRVGPEFSWRNPGFDQEDRHPVVNVTWNDAMEFCKWKSRRESAVYRLPTEAEWEYAALAGEPPPLERPDELRANVADLSLRRKHLDFPCEARFHDRYPFTSPVGTFGPNAWGVADLAGNALEWCSDWQSENYEGAATVDPTGPETGAERVARGGSWAGRWFEARPTGRIGAAPPTSGSCITGFRVVREVAPAGPAAGRHDVALEYRSATH